MPQVTKGRSTFLKGRHLAGLKVCSVSSSPSIVSVQSDRGASCNSKPSQQSPGPAWPTNRAHRMARPRACTDSDVARKVAEEGPP